MATVRDVIEGLQILAKYEKRGLDAQIGGADHDVIWGCGPKEHGERDDATGLPVTTAVSEADAKRLIELGWHVSSECDVWARFV